MTHLESSAFSLEIFSLVCALACSMSGSRTKSGLWLLLAIISMVGVWVL